MKTEKISGWYGAARKYAAAHKVISTVAVVVLLGGGYFVYGRLTAPSTALLYVLGTVQKGTIVSAVSASGQVSAVNQISIQPKASGDIGWIGVVPGQVVHAGQALMSIDATTAQRAVDDAKKSLVAAQLQYQKDSAQAPINYQNDVDALATAKESLANDYNDAYNNLSNTYLDLPAVTVGAQNALYGYDFDSRKSQWNMDVLTNLFTTPDPSMLAFKDKAKADYTASKTAYDASVAAYAQISRSGSTDALDQILSQSIDMTTAVAQALQSELNFFGSVSDLSKTNNVALPSAFSTLQSTTRAQLSTVNSDLSTLLTQRKTITTAKQTIATDENNIVLDQVGNQTGENPISLQIEKNNLEKQQQDLAQQEVDLANYTVVAPFAGTIATVDAKVGTVAGNASVATIITNQQVAQLSLNEVDAAKINLGDKATLTFDAIDALTLTGSVVQIDSVGTVSQGVVSYTVKIALAAEDSRIKPGMTVNANVQTAVRQDTLMVPSSAVKTQNGASYVLAFNPPLTASSSPQGVASATAPIQVPVTTGISDDTNVEIVSGLNEGQQIVTRTTTSAAATTAARTTTTTNRGGGIGGTGIRLP